MYDRKICDSSIFGYVVKGINIKIGISNFTHEKVLMHYKNSIITGIAIVCRLIQ